MKPNWPLLALALGAFGIGTTEFAPMGLLPVIAHGLAISLPKAGLLVTGYAVGVVIGAPLLTLTTARVDRRTLLVGLMVLFTLGNALSAMAPSYATLMAARVITSFCHGAYFGVGAIVAARFVSDGKAAGAVALVFSGLTVANIGGVPLAAWVGDHIGWRTAYGGIAAIGIAAAVALALVLPSLPGARAPDFRAEAAVLARREVLLALATTTFSAAAMFTVFTFISPILQIVTHVGSGTVTVALVIYGIGLTVGNALGGRFADGNLMVTLAIVLVALCILLLTFAWTMHSAIPAIATIFAWGIATFALVPPLQARIMAVAGGAPSLAGSVNIGAFNLGNALGAALGGQLIALDLSYEWLAVAGAGMAALALALVVTQLAIPKKA